MDPQSELWNYAISALVQRSSGGQLLGSDLYQELRLKAKNSFRSKDGFSRGMSVIDIADKTIQIIEVDQPVRCRSIEQEVKIEHRTVLNHLHKAGLKKKLDVWVPHQF
ncbi:hypothetical protein TNCT_166261 [Trichonephila clavata]|uniref:Uncharacterized protein n=1 Tax=Trichonephila clavata TaxID=2740835 RepID=A0A8X6GWT7_TRICU|nr:hypothetical protein TNCT_166261 [Trichonephila clavata]